MNYSTAIFLINKDVRAIAATYEGMPNEKPVIFKTLDPSIKVDDFIVVPTDTRHKMTVLKVVAVNVDIDFDSDKPMHWVIDKVDRHDFEKTAELEEEAIKRIRVAEFNKRRLDLRSAMFASSEDLKAIPLASLNGETHAAD